MNTMRRVSLIFILALAVLLVFPGTVQAQSPDCGSFVVGGSCTLQSGEQLNSGLVVMGGNAILEEGSTVNGSVVVAGGSMTADGEVNGDITVTGGAISLGDTAVVHGDVITIGGAVSRAPGAQIDGSVRTEDPGQFNFDMPRIPTPGTFMPNFGIDLRPIGEIFLGLFQVLAMSALAVLVALFLPNPTHRVANAIVVQPVLTGALGLLTILVAPALLLMLALTIILSPVSLLGILVVVIAAVFGWIALGTEAGRRMAAMLNTEWTIPVSAGLGTLVITFVAWLVGQIPCVGWVVPFLVTIIGLGAVVITRFGTRAYIPGPPAPLAPAAPASPAPRPPAPPAPVQPPAPTEPAPPADEPGEPLP